MIAVCATRRAKFAVAAVVAVYALAVTLTYSIPQGTMALVCGLLLLSNFQAQVPRPLAALAMTLAGASLYIYLTHTRLGRFAQQLAPDGGPVVTVALTLLGGVVIWKLVTWCEVLARNWFARSRVSV